MTETTKTKNHYLKDVPESLRKEIPSVLIFYSLKQGRKVDIRLEVTGNLSDNTPLMVELVSQEGDLSMTPTPVNSRDLTASFIIDKGTQQGSHILQVTYHDYVLESTTFEVLDEESVRQMEEFDRGLKVQDQVYEAVEKGNYNQAIDLQKEAATHFLNANNPELAANSWEDLADILYDENQLAFSKHSLQEALEIYSGVKELENREEILTRIREEMEICDQAIADSKTTKTKIQLRREEKGYSQTQLAALVGVTPEIIQAWEEGQRLEELKQFFELAQVLNCKVDDLMEIKDNLSIKDSKPLSNRQIYSNIRNLREKQKYSQNQLALLVGVTGEVIQKWEDGDELGELLRYFELAQVLDCKSSELIEYVDSIIKPTLQKFSPNHS